MNACPHQQFIVTGLVESAQVKKRRRYRLTVDVRCAQCDERFTFLDGCFDGKPVQPGGEKLRWEIEPGNPTRFSVPPKP